MSGLEIRYAAQGPTLQRFHEAEGLVECIIGPLGSGKTTAAAFKVFKRICAQAPYQGVRRSRVAVVRNTFRDLEATVVRDWRDLVPDSLGKFQHSPTPEHRLSFRLNDGTTVEAEVMFIALDRDDDVRKLRGTQFSFGWANEAKELPWPVINMLLGRIGRYPRASEGGVTWAGLVMDTNAPDEDHPLYRMAELEAPSGRAPGWLFFRQPGGVMRTDGGWVENPEAENLNNLPAGYYSRQLAGASDDWIRVNLANEYGFVVDGKPVHPDYQDSIHAASERLQPIKGRMVIVGLDFGLTPAAGFLQQQANGRWMLFRELVTEDMTIEPFAQLLKATVAEYPGYEFKFWGDPAGDQRSPLRDDETVFRVLEAQGIRALPCRSNDPVLRREALAKPLRRLIQGKPGFVVDPTCIRARKALAGGFCYRRLRVANERYADKPDKNIHSHIVEAIEYGLLGGGEDARVSGQAPQMQVIQVNNDWNPLG